MNKFIGIALSLALASNIGAIAQSTDQVTTPHKVRIGLALGGGGSRGSAHVGVLKVLKEEHIPIDMIAGTSIGSVVGGFYAAGMPLDKIADVFEKNTFTKEFTPMPALRLALVPTTLLLRAFGAGANHTFAKSVWVSSL